MKRRWNLIAQSILVTMQGINAGVPWKHQLIVAVIISSIQGGLSFYAHGLDVEGNKL